MVREPEVYSERSESPHPPGCGVPQHGAPENSALQTLQAHPPGPRPPEVRCEVLDVRGGQEGISSQRRKALAQLR